MVSLLIEPSYSKTGRLKNAIYHSISQLIANFKDIRFFFFNSVKMIKVTAVAVGFSRGLSDLK